MPDVLMPRLSDTMSEGILVQWLKHEGDQVQRGDVLAEIETDKATMELEAYDTGVLTRIIANPGTTVPIGQPIAVIGDGSVDSEPPATTPSTGDGATNRPSSPPVGTSPLARSMARKHGLDMASIVGTGPGGRIVRADVEAAIAARPGASRPASPSVAAIPAAPAVRPVPVSAHTQDDLQVPLSSIRRITAQRLTESAAAPHFYLTSVVDAEALLALRTQLNDQLPDLGSKVSVTDLLIRACAVVLRAHPEVNSSWGGDHLVRHARINVGYAVALHDGLIVPVIRDADRKSITEIATAAHELTERARSGNLTPDQFSGGTFTISNLGMYGIDHFTAVINPPEAGILAVGAARAEAVVRNGQLAAGITMKLTLAIDHRVLDGGAAAAFLHDLVGLIEVPLRVLA